MPETKFLERSEIGEIEPQERQLLLRALTAIERLQAQGKKINPNTLQSELGLSFTETQRLFKRLQNLKAVGGTVRGTQRYVMGGNPRARTRRSMGVTFQAKPAILRAKLEDDIATVKNLPPPEEELRLPAPKTPPALAAPMGKVRDSVSQLVTADTERTPPSHPIAFEVIKK